MWVFDFSAGAQFIIHWRIGVELKNSVDGKIIAGYYIHKFSKKTWLAITGFALFYFYLFLFYPKPIQVSIVFFPFGILLLSIIRKPRLWLLFFPVFITFGTKVFDFGPFYSSVATFTVLGAMFYYLIIKLAGFRTFPNFPFPFFVVFLAYFFQMLSMFVSLSNHDNLPWNTIREANKIFISALLLLIIYDWFGRGEWFDKMLKMVVILLFVMSLYGFYQYFFGNLDTFGEEASGYDIAGRVYSTIQGGPNSYSGVLELLVPTTLAAVFYFKKKYWKFFALTTTLFGIQNVLYTFSRGGFITVTLSCLAFLLYRYRKKVWIPITISLIFIGSIFANTEEFERQLTIFNDSSALMLDTSLLHRYTSYKGFLNQIEKDPFIGVGWGSREFFHSRVSLYAFWEVRHEDSINKIDRFGGLNSLILEMPLKGGILSGISLLLILFALIVTSGKSFTQARDKSLAFGLTCGLFAFAVHQGFDNLLPWPQTGAFFWMIFALLISLTYPCCGKELDSL